MKAAAFANEAVLGPYANALRQRLGRSLKRQKRGGYMGHPGDATAHLICIRCLAVGQNKDLSLVRSEMPHASI
jgi:hypothetical protein